MDYFCGMEKIDLVYLWVDGNDPEWKMKKRKALIKRGEEPAPEALNKGRFMDNNELKYSLRSVEMYAPWINKIWIVTDDQTPAWLNTEHPKIKMVSHRDILPAEYLPTFNSHAIEASIPNIEGLAERFLYANDDTFFAKPTTPDFFYTQEGFPIARFSRRMPRHTSLYMTVVRKAGRLVWERCGKNYNLNPHHNIDAYLKSDVIACNEEFKEQVDFTRSQQFRTTDDLQRIVWLYWALAKGRAKKRIVRHYTATKSVRERVECLIRGKYSTDSRSFGLHGVGVEKRIEKYNPVLMCLNDTEMATDNCRSGMKNYLERRFPQKSSFEK